MTDISGVRVAPCYKVFCAVSLNGNRSSAVGLDGWIKPGMTDGKHRGAGAGQSAECLPCLSQPGGTSRCCEAGFRGFGPDWQSSAYLRGLWWTVG